MLRMAVVLVAIALAAAGCGRKSDPASESEEIRNLWSAEDKKVNELLSKAQQQRDSGQIEAAIDLYGQAIKLYDGTDATKYTFNWGQWAQMNIGEAFAGRQKWDEAIAAYRKLADRFRGGSPDDSWAIEAHKKIVECQRAAGREKLAVAELKRIIDAEQRIVQAAPTDPSVAWAALEIGWCYAQMKDWKRAIAAYEKAKQSYPQGSWAGQADLGIADCYAKQGDKKKARAVLSRVIEQYPRDWAETAKRRMDEMDGKPAAPRAPAGAARAPAPAGSAPKR